MGTVDEPSQSMPSSNGHTHIIDQNEHSLASQLDREFQQLSTENYVMEFTNLEAMPFGDEYIDFLSFDDCSTLQTSTPINTSNNSILPYPFQLYTVNKETMIFEEEYSDTTFQDPYSSFPALTLTDIPDIPTLIQAPNSSMLPHTFQKSTNSDMQTMDSAPNNSVFFGNVSINKLTTVSSAPPTNMSQGCTIVTANQCNINDQQLTNPIQPHVTDKQQKREKGKKKKSGKKCDALSGLHKTSKKPLNVVVECSCRQPKRQKGKKQISVKKFYGNSSGSIKLYKKHRNVDVEYSSQDSTSDNQKTTAEKKVSNVRYFLTPKDVNNSSGLSSGKGGNSYTEINSKKSKRALRQKLLPPEIMAKQRNASNAREAKRIHGIMDAFVRLSDHLPNLQNGRNLSKIETLNMAIAYIKALDDIIPSNSSRGTIAMAASKAYRNVIVDSTKRKMQRWLDEKLKSI